MLKPISTLWPLSTRARRLVTVEVCLTPSMWRAVSKRCADMGLTQMQQNRVWPSLMLFKAPKRKKYNKGVIIKTNPTKRRIDSG